MISDKEKLEEELKLLKESLDLNVITEEEYNSAKERIDVKLNEVEAPKEMITSSKEVEEGTEENKKIEIKEMKTDEVGQEKEPVKEAEEEVGTPEERAEEAKEEVHIEEKNPEEPIKDKEDTITIDFNWLKNIFGRKEEPAAEQPAEEAKIEEKPEKILDEEKEAPKEVEEEKTEEESKPKEEIEEERPEELLKEPAKEEEITVEGTKSNKKLYGYIALILILVAGIGYTLIPEKSDAPYVPTIPTIDSKPDDSKPSKVILIACSSDKECTKEGSIGTCKHSGTENAECEYIEDIKVKLTILNSDDCFNCQTKTKLSIIKSFFPNLDINNVDLDTQEGNDLITKFGIDVLPAYILNSSLQKLFQTL